MLGLLNFRAYVFIALIVMGVLLAIWYFDKGHTLVAYVDSTGATAAQALGTTVSGFVTGPIHWAMTDWIGAVVAGLIWPIAIVWLILFLALFVFSIFAPTIGAATNLG